MTNTHKDNTVPDPSVTREQMVEYGYTWEGMTPLGREMALELFEGNDIFLLYNDGTESLAQNKADVEEFPGMFGIETGDENRPWETLAIKRKKDDILAVINGSSGTENYHKFSMIPKAPVGTDGTLRLAVVASCFWLLDIIVSYQHHKRLDPNFQVWKLQVDVEKKNAVVSGYNDTNDLVVMQIIPYTDFPLDEVTLFLVNGVILLPSEY